MGGVPLSPFPRSNCAARDRHADWPLAPLQDVEKVVKELQEKWDKVENKVRAGAQLRLLIADERRLLAQDLSRAGLQGGSPPSLH